MTFIISDFTTTDGSAPKIITPYAKDSFTRSNGNPGVTEVGAFAWSDPRGTWKIVGGVLESGDTTAATPADITIDPHITDGTFSVKVISTGAADHAAMMFRLPAIGNAGWTFYARGAGWTLAKRTGSDSFTVVPVNGANIPFSPGQVGSVTMEGNRIICKVNGVVTHDVTDATYSGQTRLGFGTRLATTVSPARFDDFIFSE